MLHPLAQLDSIPTSEEQQVLAETESGILTADAAIAAACGDTTAHRVSFRPCGGASAASGSRQVPLSGGGRGKRPEAGRSDRAAAAGGIFGGYCHPCLSQWRRRIHRAEHSHICKAYPPDGQFGCPGAVSAVRPKRRPIPTGEGRFQPCEKDPFRPALYASRLLLRGTG